MNYIRPVGIDQKRKFIKVGTMDERVEQDQPDQREYAVDGEEFTCVSAPYEPLVLFVRRHPTQG